jgi:hypothetical protein
VEDKDHEEGDRRQIAAHQRRHQPGAPATYRWALRRVTRLHRQSLLKDSFTPSLKAG